MPTEASERRITYLKRRKRGCCPRCGVKKNKGEKFIYCKDCRAYFRGYNEDVSDKTNKLRRKKYNLRKKNNQCPRCGTKLGKRYEKTLCVTCLEKQYKYNYRKKRPKKAK